MMSGANPALTHQLLDQSLHRRRFNDLNSAPSSPSSGRGSSVGGANQSSAPYVGGRDHADALCMAYLHLEGQSLLDGGAANIRTNMLTNAAKCYEKLGDVSAMTDCRSLLSTIARDDQRAM